MLEVRIPISPKPAWLNRVRLIAASVREWYQGTEVRVYVGTPEMPTTTTVADVSGRCNATGIRWVYGDEFNRWANTRAEYSETVFSRFRGEFYGDWVLLMDCDCFPVARFNEMFTPSGISGVTTHVPPWPQDEWCRLFTGFGLPLPAFNHLHTGSGIMCAPETYAPRGYYNSGVLLGRRKWFEALEAPMFEAIEYLRGALSPEALYWVDQAAFCLGVNAACIPTQDFPINFNHPNREPFDQFYGTHDLRFVHAMQTDGGVDRDADFESSATLAALCSRTLTGSNEVLRQRIMQIREAAGI